MSEPKIVKRSTADGSVVTVALSGTLTIEDAAEFQGALAAALREAPTVLLDAGQLARVDMTILQIICSACKTAARERSAFLPEGGLPGCMETFVNSIGARMMSICKHNNNESCKWFGGGK